MPSPVDSSKNAVPYTPDTSTTQSVQDNSIDLGPVMNSLMSGKGTGQDYYKSAMNHLLFKAPQAIAENIDPSQVQNFKDLEQTTGGKIGGVAGDIGSSMIPVGGGIGLAGKGAGLAKTIAGGAINAGINSGGQQTIRELVNAAAATPEGRTPDISLGNIGTAATEGAGLGALFHGIVGAIAGKSGSAVTKATAEEIAAAQKLKDGGLLNINKTGANGELVPADPVHPDIQKSADAYVNKISGGQNGPIRDALEGQTPLNQASNINAQTVNTAQVGTKYKIFGENTPKELAEANAAIKGSLDKIDAVAQPSLGAIKATVGSDEALSQAMKATSQIPDQAVQNKVQQQIGAIHQAMMGANSASDMRTILNQGLDTMSAQMANDATVRYGYQALKGIKDSFNKSLSNIMASNPETAGLAQVPQEYGILQDIGAMSTMQQMSSLAAKSGPGTLEKGLGAVTQHPTTLLKTILRPGAKKIDQLIATPFPDAVGGVAGRTAGSSTGISGVPPVNGGNANIAPQTAINEMSKKDDKSGPQSVLVSDLYDNNGNPTPTFNNLSKSVTDRVEQILTRRGENIIPGDVEKTQASVMKGIINPDKTLNIQALGNVMFDNPQDREKFSQAASAYNQMIPNIKDAFQSNHGIPGVSNIPIVSQANVGISNLLSNATPNANAQKSARNAIIKGLHNFTGSGDDEYNANEAIVNSSSPQDLEKRLLSSMKSSNSTGYNLLKQAGIVP
jgi:hypothetical protein